MKLTSAQCAARAIALEEAADHLQLRWSLDPVEIEQGNIVSEALMKQAKKWWARADISTEPISMARIPDA